MKFDFTVMLKILSCLCACAALTLASGIDELRCTDPLQCVQVDSRDPGVREFEVEGKIVTIKLRERKLNVDCNDWAALDSKALPSFREAQVNLNVVLKSCPLPASGSFKSAFSTLNVTLHSFSLALQKLAAHPPLQPLKQCDELQQLALYSPVVDALPERWVAHCPHLEFLNITHARHLESLPSKLLENATALRHLSLTKGVLKELPTGLLDDVLPNLITLNLWGNRLHMLPSGLLARAGALRYLNLASNKLSAAAAAELAKLHSLEFLNLGYNRNITDLCDTSTDYSPLVELKKLTRVTLFGTSITRICRDWREDLTSLKVLDLQYTKISELRLSDLHFIRDDAISNDAEVFMAGVPVTHIHCSEAEYNASLVAPRSGALVYLYTMETVRLQCDCTMYWTRLALFPTTPQDTKVSTSSYVRVGGLTCSAESVGAGRGLGAVSPDELKCA